MSDLQINSVLSQIRAMSAQVQNVQSGVSKINPAALKAQQAEPGSFANVLKNGIDQVNQTQQRAGELATSFERGTPGVEISDVMLEMQKANVSFRALTEV